jgi:MFS family permease
LEKDELVLRNVWLSSWVLSIALLGDALLYVVLPVNAEAFGVSMAAVGLLLSINRIARTFTYGLVVRFAEKVGYKKTAFIASIIAATSTLGYAISDGVFALCASRISWGLSYAALLLVTLNYASINPNKIGKRIGISRSVEQVGPLTAMLGGAWIAVFSGPKTVFIYMAIFSLLSVVLSMYLTNLGKPISSKTQSKKGIFIPKPESIDILMFWMGFGIDGVFTVTIALMWVEYSSLETAIIIGGFILAARRMSEMVIAPLAGQISDKYGEKIPLLLMILLCCLGFMLIGCGMLILGSTALVICRGALGTLFPAAVSKLYAKDAMSALTRNQTWRDVGAAAGPLLTGVLVGITSPELIHLFISILFLVSFGWFFNSMGWETLN